MADPLVEPFGAAVAALEPGPQRLAGALHAAAREKAVEAYGPRRSEFESLELETKLWDLVARTVAQPHAGGADAGGTDAALATAWLQANLQQPAEPALQSIKWMYTRGEQNKRGARPGGAVVTQLDADAPLREARPLAKEDSEKDDALFRYVFELLLAGEYALARAACADTNNWLLLAAVDALLKPDAAAADDDDDANLAGLSALDAHRRPGEEFALVREACRALSSSGSSSALGGGAAARVSAYEAGVYGLLGGNLAAVAPLCTSWETLLLAHLVCGADVDAFERAVRADHKLALQGADWRRRIALALVQNKLDTLIDALLAEVADPARAADSAVVQHPWIVRLLLHAQLALGGGARTELVQIYIEYLCGDGDAAALGARLRLVPAYVRLLRAPGDRTRVYAHVLAQITDAATQAQQVELAAHYGLDLAPVVAAAVRQNFDLYERSIGGETDAMQDETASEADARLVGVLRWPVAAGLWTTAAHALVRAYALLLARGRREAVVLLTHEISADEVRERAMDVVRARLPEQVDVVADLAQLRQYALLGAALAALAAWRAAAGEESGERGGSGGSGAPRRATVAASWRATAPKLVGAVLDTVDAALRFAPPPNETSERVVAEMDALRSRYIPQLVYELLAVLREAQSISSGYARVALDFAVKIAGEDLQLYRLFDAQLLHALAEQALVLDEA